MTAVISPDSNQPAEPHQGLSIRTFKVAADGTRYDDSGVLTVDAEHSSATLHPSAMWPPCTCPRHRKDSSTH